MRITRNILVLFATRNFICCNALRCKTAKDINPPACNIEDLKDGVLKDICENVGYIYKSKPTRKQLVYSARLCYEIETRDYMQFMSPEVSKELDEYLAVGFDENIEEDKVKVDEDVAFENDGIMRAFAELIYHDYLDMMKKPSFVNRSRHDRISYLLSKRGIDDVKEKSTLRKLFLERLEKDIAKLPKWSDSYSDDYIGSYDGQTKLFQSQDNIIGASWSTKSQTWYKRSESEYTRDSGKMELFWFCLILLFALLGTYLYMTSQYKKKKKVRKPAPRKSSSSCHGSSVVTPHKFYCGDIEDAF